MDLLRPGVEGAAGVLAAAEVGDDARPLSQAELKSLKGIFTGATVDCELPCTAAEGAPCHIVSHLSSWNEFLCWGFLQLREAPAGTTVVLSRVPWESAPLGWRAGRLHRVASLVYWLLKTHCCVARVELNARDFQAYPPFLQSALLGDSFVTSLKVTFGGRGRHGGTVPDVLLPPSHVLELEYAGRPDHSATLLAQLSAVLRAAWALSVLRTWEVRLWDAVLAGDLLRALGEHSCLKELVLPDSIIALAPPSAQALFMEYLQSTTSLGKLTVTAGHGVRVSLGLVLEGLRGNSSVADAAFEDLAVDRSSVQLISEIFAQNKALQSFSMSRGSRRDADINHPSTETDWDCVVKALVDNETLRRVTLSIEIWEAKQWQVLFEALPTKTRLEAVTIEVGQNRALLPRLCAMLTGANTDKKVSFKASFVDDTLYDDVTCNTFSEVALRSSERKRAAMRKILDRSPTRSFISTLHPDFELLLDWQRISSAMTTFIRESRSLKAVTVRVEASFDNFCQVVEIGGVTLSGNDRELHVWVDLTRVPDSWYAEPLADALNGSKNLCRICFYGDEPRSGERAFFRRLSAGIGNNYTLLSVITLKRSKMESHWFHIWDATRRNSDLLTGAADFARGARRDRRGALALERVHNHPELVEQIARLESIDEGRAVVMVQDGLRSTEGMHDFMRLAGVVRERVTCYAREDARAQLDILNEDCWRWVRRYLKMRDVRDAVTHPLLSFTPAIPL